MSLEDISDIFCQITLIWTLQDLTNDYSILVQVIIWYSGNKPLPETMLTQIYVTICHH